MNNRDIHKWQTAVLLTTVLSCGPVATAMADTLITETVVAGSTQTINEVLVSDVRTEDGVVSGIVVNRTPHELRDVGLLIRYDWLWKNEFSPGENSPGRAVPYSVPQAIPPGGEVPFTYYPETPLSQRPDGSFLTSVVVLRYTQFK